jgi:colanic acid/amylovoran biosynthesis glycosyltransferase
VEASNKLAEFYRLFAHNLRLSNPWKFKVPVLISIPYLLLFDAKDVSESYFFIGLSYCTIVGIACFGYLTNDLADRRTDEISNKPNGTSNLGTVSIILVGFAAMVFAILPWFVFPTSLLSWGLVLLELLLFVLYAFPPFRLKELPFIGAITDALYAHAVPALLASITFVYLIDQLPVNRSSLLISLVAWQFVVGLRGIIFHHLKDYNNDISSNTRTLATQLGIERLERITKRFLIPVEFLSFLVFVYQLNWNLPLALSIASVFILRSVFLQIKMPKAYGFRTFVHAHLDDFYIRWFPLIILGFLLISEPKFLGLACIHVLFFPSLVKDWYHRLKGHLLTPVRTELATNSNRVLRVAIVTHNRNQYSETFIHAHINGLGGEVVILFDGYLPAQFEVRESNDCGYLTDDIWEGLSEVDLLIKRQQCVSEFLMNRSVDVVLAEYGPAGVEMMIPCKLADVPLVTHFHGFDAFRKDVLEYYGIQYPFLFNQAKAILVVSEPMEKQLIALGCPKERLNIIANGVDTNYFKPEGVKRPLSLVFCGRFVEKKAPQLVIKASALVIAENPSVQLTMIGDGVLLSECKSLVDSLGLRASIRFTGALYPDQVLKYLQRSSLFVQHSITAKTGDSEGLPISILEALACELPVIATKHAGIPSVVIDGETGYLVEEGDVESMARKVSELLQNEELRVEIGRKGRQLILDRHSIERNISQLEIALKMAANQ